MSIAKGENRVIEDTTVYKTHIVQDPLSKYFGYDFTIVSKEPQNTSDWFLSDIIGVDMFLAAIRSSDVIKKKTNNESAEQPLPPSYKNEIRMTRRRNNNIYTR